MRGSGRNMEHEADELRKKEANLDTERRGVNERSDSQETAERKDKLHRLVKAGRNLHARATRKIITLMAVFVAIIAVICFLTFKSIGNFEKTIIGQTQGHLLNVARTQAQAIESDLQHVHEELERLARMPELQRLITGESSGEVVSGENNCEEFAFERLEETADALYRLDANGIIQRRIPLKEERIGQDYSDKPGVRYVIENHVPYVSQVFNSTSGLKSVSVSCPVFKDNEFIGIVRATIFSHMIESMAEHLKDGERRYAQIIDHRGIVVAHPSAEQVGKDIISVREAAFPDHDWSDLREIVSRMCSGQEGVGSYHSAWWTEERLQLARKLTAFAPIRIGNELWSIGVTMDYDEIANPVRTHTRGVLFGAGFLVLAVIGAAVGVYKIEKREVELQTQLRFTEKLKSLASELVLLEERERQLIAEELHDNLAQLLALSKMKLQSLEQSLESDEQKDELNEVCDVLSQSMAQMKTLMFDLSNALLHELGLVASLDEWLDEKIVKAHGIKAQIEDDGKTKELDKDTSVLLFRSVKELLMNVVKHANAESVRVSIEQVNGEMHVIVADDGIGFEVSNVISTSVGVTAGFGLFSIRDRMEQFGGRMEIHSDRGRGTRVVLVVPVTANERIAEKSGFM